MVRPRVATCLTVVEASDLDLTVAQSGGPVGLGCMFSFRSPSVPA